MNPANTAAIAQARVLAVTAPAVGADPMCFLRRTGAGPRGFWARSDGWIAHSGALVTVTAEGAHPGGLFSGIEANALDLFAPGSMQGVGDTPGVRFFGGFAFCPEYATEELWAGFPPALFHVPALELECVSGQDPVPDRAHSGRPGAKRGRIDSDASADARRATFPRPCRAGGGWAHQVRWIWDGVPACGSLHSSRIRAVRLGRRCGACPGGDR